MWANVSKEGDVLTILIQDKKEAQIFYNNIAQYAKSSMNLGKFAQCREAIDTLEVVGAFATSNVSDDSKEITYEMLMGMD